MNQLVFRSHGLKCFVENPERTFPHILQIFWLRLRVFPVTRQFRQVARLIVLLRQMSKLSEHLETFVCRRIRDFCKSYRPYIAFNDWIATRAPTST